MDPDIPQAPQCYCGRNNWAWRPGQACTVRLCVLCGYVADIVTDRADITEIETRQEIQAAGAKIAGTLRRPRASAPQPDRSSMVRVSYAGRATGRDA